jgi:hypothetical protein
MTLAFFEADEAYRGERPGTAGAYSKERVRFES